MNAGGDMRLHMIAGCDLRQPTGDHGWTMSFILRMFLTKNTSYETKIHKDLPEDSQEYYNGGEDSKGYIDSIGNDCYFIVLLKL